MLNFATLNQLVCGALTNAQSHLDVYKRQVIEQHIPGFIFLEQQTDLAFLVDHLAHRVHHVLAGLAQERACLFVDLVGCIQLAFLVTVQHGCDQLGCSGDAVSQVPVSYTHLDVYKRQWCARPCSSASVTRNFTTAHDR